MSNRILGIEIGHAYIKLLEVTKFGESIKVHRFSLINTPKESIKDGIICHVESIQKLIMEEMHLRKYRAKKVVGIIQSNQIIIRNELMDQTNRREIWEKMSEQAEYILPIKTKEYQIAYKVVEEVIEKRKEKSRVVFIATPNKIMVPVLHLIQSINRVPVLVTVPSEALSYLCTQDRETFPSKGVLIMDLGGYHTYITIVSEYKEVFSKEIGYGLENIKEEIMESELEEDVDIETYLQNIVWPHLTYHILEEVERILRYFETHFYGGTIEKVYLIGGGAYIKGIRTFVRDTLGKPTEIINQMEHILVAPKIDFESKMPYFVNVLGAIKGV